MIFALPIILGNLFQQAYIMADSAIVGRHVSQEALAAVGACNSLCNIFICVAIGGGIGASVIVSRLFGAGKYSDMKRAMYTAMLSFLAVSIVLGAAGLLLGRTLLELLKTPWDAIDLAEQYLAIYFIGLPFLFMYNVLSSLFNSLGKSRIPLMFLIFSSLLNVGLDIFFVVRLGMGIEGVAWATLIAQGISAVLSFVVLLFYLRRFDAPAGGIFDKTLLREMTRVALPSIFQQSTVSIGMMLVQSVVNGFGSEVLAGFSAAMRIEGICVVPFIGIGNALSSYTAQNLGAARPDRVARGLKAGLIMAAGFAAAMTVLFFFAEPIITSFLGEDGTLTAIETGKNCLSFMCWFYFFIGLKMAFDGILRGSGDVKVFTLANFANLALRVAVAFAFAPTFGIQFVWFAVPVGWLVNSVITFLRYRSGAWRNK